MSVGTQKAAGEEAGRPGYRLWREKRLTGKISLCRGAFKSLDTLSTESARRPVSSG